MIRNGYKLLWRSGSKAENGVGDEWKLLLGMRSGKLSCAIITHRLGGEPWKRRNYMKLLIGLWPGKKFLLVVTSIVILEGRLVALVKFMEVMWLASGMCVCVCVCVCVWVCVWMFDLAVGKGIWLMNTYFQKKNETSCNTHIMPCRNSCWLHTYSWLS